VIKIAHFRKFTNRGVAGCAMKETARPALAFLNGLLLHDGNASATDRGSGSFLTRKTGGLSCRNHVSLTYSGLRFPGYCFGSSAPRGTAIAPI
jgi:hypothetical protein